MYNALRHAHSGLRWVVLALLIAAIVVAYQKMSKKDTSVSKQPFLFNLIGVHVQLILGLILYGISPKVSFTEGFMKVAELRFFAVEHIVMMILVTIIITIGYSKGKRQEAPKRYKTLFIFNLIGLIIILAAIPWPFRGLGAGWF